MSSPDIRWKQRLSNFKQAFAQLSSAVQISQARPLSDLERQGIIQAFEFTHELAWNVMKDYFEYQGTTGLSGSRDATRESFKQGLIQKGDIWMEMIKSRNQTTHTYNEGIASEIIENIIKNYFGEFDQFLKKMSDISQS